MDGNTMKMQIITVFGEFGYQPVSVLNRAQTFSLMNNIATTNSSTGTIQPETVEELWNAGSNNSNLISIDALATTISQGLKSLKQEHDIVQNKINNTTNDSYRKQLLIQLYSISYYYGMLGSPFRISRIYESPLIYQSLKLIPETIKNKQKYIFSFQPTQQTIGLKILLWMAMMLLGLEVIMMFHKEHFYTLLCLCMVLSIFLLNYFDAKFIRFVMGNLLFSTFLDLIWEISNAKRYWNRTGDDFICFQHSNILRFSTMFILLVAVGKLMMAGILIKYRNNPTDYSVNLEFLELRFNLDADPNNNPISRLL